MHGAAPAPAARAHPPAAKLSAADALEAAYERGDQMSDDPRVSAELARLERAVHGASEERGADGLTASEASQRDLATRYEDERAARARTVRDELAERRGPSRRSATADEQVASASTTALRVAYKLLRADRSKSDRADRIAAELTRRGEEVPG